MKFITRYKSKKMFFCEHCDGTIWQHDHYYVITNNAEETEKLCADCAAHYMAETLDAVHKTEYSNQGDAK